MSGTSACSDVVQQRRASICWKVQYVARNSALTTVITVQHGNVISLITEAMGWLP